MEYRDIINKFVHDPEAMLALGLVVDQRINELKDDLVTASIDRVPGIQSSIKELNRLKDLKSIIKRKQDNNG